DPRTPPHNREDARLIRRSVAIEARIINALLDVTRIAKGKLDLQPETVDLHLLIEDAVKACRREINSKQLRLIVSLHANERFVRGDPARLRQILWNLLRNAAKFTPGGGQVTLECVNPDDPSRIRMIVSD